MSKKIASVHVSLEAEVSKFRKDLERLEKKVGTETKKMKKSLNTISTGFKALITVEAARRVTGHIIRVTDKMLLLEGRVKQATRDTGDFQKAWDGLGKIAFDTGTELTASVEVFQRLSMVRERIGATTEDMLTFVRTVQNLGIVSGTSQEAMSRALVQLGQGMTSVKLRAEEYNSVVENAPAIIMAVEKSMGLVTGEMGKMVRAGEFFSKDILPAINKQSDEAAEAAGQIPLTVERAAKSLNNAWDLFIHSLERSTGFVQGLAAAIKNAAQWLMEITGNTIDHQIRNSLKRIENLEGQLEGWWGTLNSLSSENRKLIEDNIRQEKELIESLQQLKRITKELEERNNEVAYTYEKIEEEGKQVVDAQQEWKQAVKEVNTELQDSGQLSRDIATAGGTIEKVWGPIGEKTGGAMGNIQTAEANARLLKQASDEVNDSMSTGVDLSEELKITWEEITRDTVRGIRDAWVSFFEDVFHGKGIDSIKSFLQTVKDMFLRIIAEIAAAWVTSKIFGGLAGLGILPGITGAAGAGIFSGAGSAGGAVIGGVAATKAVAGTAAATGTIAAPAAAIPGTAIWGGAGTGGLVGTTGLTESAIIAGKTGGVGAGTGAGGLSGNAAAAGPYVAAAAIAAFGYMALTMKNRGFGGSFGAKQEKYGPQNIRGGQIFGPEATTSQIYADFAKSQDARVIQEGGKFLIFKEAKEGAKNINDIFREFQELQKILPQVERVASQAFGDMGDALEDGVVNTSELAEIGIVTLGKVSVEQFGQLAEAVNKGTISMDSLTGATKFTEQEMETLGSFGIETMDEIKKSTGQATNTFSELTGSVADTKNNVVDLGTRGDWSMDKVSAASDATDRGFQALSRTVRSTKGDVVDFGHRGDSSMDRISDASRKTTSSISTLTSTVATSQSTVSSFGNVGARSLDDIRASADRSREGFRGLRDEIDNAARSARGLGDVRVPSPSNRHEGGSFIVGGQHGIDANLVSFMADKGERVTVTPTDEVGAEGDVVLELMALRDDMRRRDQQMNTLIRQLGTRTNRQAA